MRMREPARNAWPNGYIGTRTSGRRALRERRDVGPGVGLHREERGRRRRVERALAGAQPPALHVGLLAVGTHLGDRHLEVDVGRVVDRTHRSTLPVPSITVSAVSGAVTYATALPVGTGFQSYVGR